ncbi:MAG: acyltransferase [Anaerolineae bacterium]|nr:acyltransferase [Anaerolineae bacterium]
MIRRLSLLGGLSILAVVASHAAGWGFIAMFFWTDRYRPVTVPNYDQIGTLSYYILVAVRSWASFAVAAFLFLSGFFLAYSARSAQVTLQWKVILRRIRSLLIPYLIWSCAILILDAMQGKIYPPGEYVWRLVSGGAHPAYYYVPLICQFYLLAPFVVSAAKTRPIRFLIAAAAIQLGALALRYLSRAGEGIPALHTATGLLWPTYAFFFALGLVASFHPVRLGQWMAKNRRFLLAGLIVSAIATVVESEFGFHVTGVRRGTGPATLSTSVYAIAFVTCFLTFDRVAVQFSKTLTRLSSMSYGIYLVHPIILELTARATQELAPGVLELLVPFTIALVLIAVVVIYYCMTLLSRSPVKRSYHYLFG